MPTFLYKIQLVRPEALLRGFTEDEKRTISDHFEYLKRLTESGTVLLAGRTTNADNSSFGIVIFSAELMEAARKIVDEDPAVANRVFRAELFPYKNSLINSNSRY